MLISFILLGLLNHYHKLTNNPISDGEKTTAQVGSNLADSNWHSLTARYDTTTITLHIYGDVGDVQEDSARFRVQGDFNIRSVRVCSLLLGILL